MRPAHLRPSTSLVSLEGLDGAGGCELDDELLGSELGSELGFELGELGFGLGLGLELGLELEPLGLGANLNS